jgi:hypothetical protein
MIIDAHVHAYTWPTVYEKKPKSSGEFASLLAKNKGKGFFNLFKEEPKDISNLLIETMDRNGISKAVVMSSVWRVPNEFMAKIIAKHPDRLVGFGKWLPGAKGSEAAEQIEEAIRKYGLRGVGEIALSDFYPIPPHELHRAPEVRLIMDKIAKLKVPILFDSGLSTAPRPLWYYDPFTIDSIANEYPEVPIIIGHSGKTEHYFYEAALMVARRKENVYLELSYQPSQNMERAVRLIGTDRCMFGTDWPRYLPNPPADLIKNQIQAVKNAEITDEEREQIMAKTISKLLGL